MMPSIHGRWSGLGSFIAAMLGIAIGLGNFWKLPYLIANYGGWAFVIAYLCFVCAVAAPLLMLLLGIGRSGAASPPNALRNIAQREGWAPAWGWLGFVAIIATLVIAAYSSVIASWIAGFALRAFSGLLIDAATDSAAATFNRFVADSERLLGWQLLFLLSVAMVVAGGVRRGVEPALRGALCCVLVLCLLLWLFVWSQFGPDSGWQTRFDLDFRRLGAAGIGAALVAAFFSVVGICGAVLAFGSYIPRDVSIAHGVLWIVIIEVLLLLLVCLIMFPLIEPLGAMPSSSTILVFVIVPLAFNQLAGGSVMAGLFFLLLLIVVWTSAIAMLEAPVAWLVERFKYSRLKAVVICFLLCTLGGILCSLSFGVVSHWQWELPVADFSKQFSVARQLNLFDTIRLVVDGIMMPMVGLLSSIFACWVLRANVLQAEWGLSDSAFGAWYFLARYVVPPSMLIVMICNIGGL